MVPKRPPQEEIPRILQNLELGKPCRLWVTGTSMVPFLRSEKDAVILKIFDGRVKRGDLLLYQRDSGLFLLHRVHRICPDGTYLLCGDNQSVLEPVSPAQVIAAVEAIERSGRQFSQDYWLWQELSAIWMGLFVMRPLLLRLMHGLWKILKG